MEHTYTKVSLLGIKKHLVLAAFATSLLVGAAHAKDIDESILLKQAILSTSALQEGSFLMFEA